jgi:hypothetical protein
MFVASHRFLPLDVLRVPHRIGEDDCRGPMGFARVSAEADGGRCSLFWPRPDHEGLSGKAPGRHALGGIPIFARVLDADLLTGALPNGWHADPPAGEAAVSLWRHEDGSLLLPFDPGEAIQLLWSEAYLAALGDGDGPSLAARAYYRVRPVLPRRMQIALRRSYSRIQARREFPRWPVEPALHDLLRLAHGWLTEIAQGPVPWLSPWPGPYRWAVVLTHDVETAAGQAQIGVMRGIERELGYRSSWNFPALRYAVDESVVAALRQDGCEIGVHGVHHDGRDLESLPMLESRLPAMRAVAERWGAEGFRSPATQRSWALMPRLGFAYDSSSPDSDPFEPQPGGCCSWWPFFNEAMVELPITMPQDHTVFTILRRDGEAAWLEKSRAIRERSGMALLLTHPDYLGTPEAAEPYRRTLAALGHDATAWRALPRDVAAWWRRRAASTVERDGDGWRVAGPAAGEGSVRLDAP